MCKVNIYEAKTNLSKYLEMLENKVEEEIIITRYDKKVAVLKLYQEDNKKKRLGAALGTLEKKEFVLKDPNDKLDELFGY